jgi:hypothetical protein
MGKRYVKTVMQHLRKVVTSHQRDWNEGLPVFLLAYKASTYDTLGMIPASLVLGRASPLCDLLFEAPIGKARPTIDHKANLVDLVHDIHHHVRQHLRSASDRTKTR